MDNRGADHHIVAVAGSDGWTMGFAGRIVFGIGCAVALAVVVPHARDGGAILSAQGDPVALSDAQLRTAARPKADDVAREIDQALAS